MYARVRAPGTCGELAQGVLQGSNFLITCPVNLYSEVSIKLLPHTADIIGAEGKIKALTAVKKVLTKYNCTYGFELSFRSDLPIGKGMASSTADVAAAALAAALALGEELTPDMVADLALSIEPSDGIFYPGIVMFDHLNGTIRRQLGNPPHLKILVFDWGGEVDTIEFNRKQDLWQKNLQKEAALQRAVELLRAGMRTKSSAKIGEAASISAIANQAILYKPKLEKLLEVVLEHGGLGVNVAHSGTVVGVLLHQHDDRLAEWLSLIRAVINTQAFLGSVDLVGGGLEILEAQCHNKAWCHR